MTVRLGLNIDSLKAQRRLGEASSRSSEVYRRLSTGQRITRAADDAAGLAISESLSSKSRVFTRGSQNIADGISALTIADAALEELTGITTRIQELAEQGANGSYSPRQRAALDKEAQTLRAEFVRIVQSTSFNGRNLFDGSVQGLSLQAGYGTDGAVASSLGGKIGTGSFAAQTTITGLNYPQDVLTTDLNGDGRLDLVAVNYGGSVISTFLGNGDGTFGTKANTTVGTSPSEVKAADFTGDGVMDLVVAATTSSRLSLLRGNGDGTFGAAQTVASGTAWSTVATADFNQDGRMDIVTADGFGSTAVLLGNGDLTFRGPTALTGLGSVDRVMTADFNGDGRSDLLARSTADSIVSVLLGKGDGTFTSSNDIEIAASLRDVTPGDFNADGNMDLFAISFSTYEVYFGTGTGTFSAAFSTNMNPGTDGWRVMAADINGDAREEAIVSSHGSQSLLAFSVLGSGGLTAVSESSVTAGPQTVVSGDFNRDGIADLVAGRGVIGTGSSLSILLGASRDGINAILPFSLQTVADSSQALSMIGRKLELLTEQRGQIGAFQSRLAAASGALSTQRDEFVAANSRIRDADFSSETAELARTQIIQNAAAAVMAQANQQPALALQLLRP